MADSNELARSSCFGMDGPLYQLFPVALVQALLALMAGKPLPAPPPSSPPTSTQPVGSDDEAVTPLAEAAPTTPNGHRPHLAIHTLGGLRLVGEGGDLTSALIERKVLAFLWLYLLARRLRNPHDSITRASLADELSPGLDRSTQRSRLRGRLSELRNELPAAIGKRLEVSGERINLDLTGCDVDLQRLLEVAGTFAKANGVLSAEQLAQLESVVSDAGTFLPDWDDLELHVNSGRGGAGEVVADLRHQVEVARAAVLRALGDGYLAHAKPVAAVTFLERALNSSPDDESVARSLIAACLQSGRLARAEELRKDFSH